MRYPLESSEGFLEDLLFWSSRFIRYKMTTLSNTKVKDKKCIHDCLSKLQKVPKTIDELEYVCKNARNAGLIGVNTYAQPIIKLYEYLKNLYAMGSIDSMKEIDEENLSDFLATETSGLSLASKRNYRIALLGLFGYIDKQNQDAQGNSHIYNIELKNIGAIKGKSGQKLPAYLNEDELERFLKGIEEFNMSQKVSCRNRLIIKMIVYTGMRVSEALQLKAKDMVLEKDLYLLNIKGKGEKYRVVMIKAIHIQDLLQDWLILRSQIEVQDGLLFCNQNGKALSQAYIYRQVEQILSSVGIRKEKNGAHMLRHSFATLLYQKRYDLVLVQEALGHADLNTSRIYTHFDKKRLLEAASVMDDVSKMD
ncbi:tyrosine-type recombinase/integrase [Helicobacter sp. 11S02596-1]|uniref:tyrosine-type recombinase/integrase n=1 Tax=Helicobacter sp. 11S02596-1 TaxID=1476194 RepID=UPI000BA511B7|nr:tyrosine-type recombinase/integrase [Helicobacter sp. 11S02596-1]PAF41501.1 integrase [Helicobacter sp. 11S02596-1]